MKLYLMNWIINCPAGYYKMIYMQTSFPLHQLRFWLNRYSFYFLSRNLESKYGTRYISVSQHTLGEIYIHGADDVVGQIMPTLLYSESKQTGDDDIGVCEDTMSIPITKFHLSRYVYISTSTCLKSFSIEVFASKLWYIKVHLKHTSHYPNRIYTYIHYCVVM